MSVNYLLYSSTAVVHFTQADLVQLLKLSRVNNQAHQLSGMLLTRGDKFIQWLEGPVEEIEILVDKIRRDRRHKNLRVLADGTLPVRAFPDWSMAFKNLTGLREDALPGYSELLQANPTAANGNFAAKKLLETLNNLVLQGV
ncbi:MAG TPA: BLUF domain-containing protein [Bryobacteraceae bacterium]|nr:BLUF domain-containing protein [Bryobacteraceae bacterium]